MAQVIFSRLQIDMINIFKIIQVEIYWDLPEGLLHVPVLTVAVATGKAKPDLSNLSVDKFKQRRRNSTARLGIFQGADGSRPSEGIVVERADDVEIYNCRMPSMQCRRWEKRHKAMWRGFKGMSWCWRVAIAALATTPSIGEVTRASVGEDDEAHRHLGHLRIRRTESGSLPNESAGTRRPGATSNRAMDRTQNSSLRRRTQATKLWCEYRASLRWRRLSKPLSYC